MYIEHAAPVPKPINMLDTIINYLFLLKDIIKPHSFIQSNFGFSSVELEGNLPFSICFLSTRHPCNDNFHFFGSMCLLKLVAKVVKWDTNMGNIYDKFMFL